WFGCDVLRHLDSGLLNPLRNGLATGEEQCAEHHIRGQEILSGASHPFNGHLLRSFAPGAMATSQNESRQPFVVQRWIASSPGGRYNSRTCLKLRFMRVVCAKWGRFWNWIGSSSRSPASVTKWTPITTSFTSSSMNRL